MSVLDVIEIKVITMKVMETAHIKEETLYRKAQECVHLLQTKSTEDPREAAATTGAEGKGPTAAAALA